MNERVLLKLDQFSVAFGVRPVVKDVSFSVMKGAWTTLVGASGSGKSVTALSIARLMPEARVGGQALWYGSSGQAVDLCAASPATLQKIRGAGIAYIFQDPASTLNPVLRVGAQLTESYRMHIPSSKAREAWGAALETLRSLNFKDAERVLGSFPHELSGGMKQRVMIASALLMKPMLLVADEPTTALDSSNQKEILEILKDLQSKKALSLLFITHDLRLAKAQSDQILVMERGRLVGTESEYSQKLFKSVRGFGAPKSLIEL